MGCAAAQACEGAPICRRRLPRSPNRRRRTGSAAKQIQAKPRKKAWISLDSFGRIRTFQWVTTNPNKKSFPVILCLNCHPGQARGRSGNWKKLITCFLFFQENTEAPTSRRVGENEPRGRLPFQRLVHFDGSATVDIKPTPLFSCTLTAPKWRPRLNSSRPVRANIPPPRRAARIREPTSRSSRSTAR